MRQQLGTLLAKCVVESWGDQIREASGVADLCVQSLKNHLNRTKQLLQEQARVRDAQIEKLSSVSDSDGDGSNAPTHPGDVENDADAGADLSSVQC